MAEGMTVDELANEAEREERTVSDLDKAIEVMTAGLAAAVEAQANMTRAIADAFVPALIDLRDAQDRLEMLGLGSRG